MQYAQDVIEVACMYVVIAVGFFAAQFFRRRLR